MFLFQIVLGLILGVGINILADDLPHRRRPGRIHCAHCRYGHLSHDHLAVIRRLSGSYRCPGCGQSESLRPLMVELGTALAFGLLWIHFGGFSIKLLITSIYFALFILIFVTDMEHRLILHAITGPAIAFALIASLATVTPISALLGAGIGFGFFLLVYLIGGLIFGSGALGFGDVTLATLIGATAGFPLVIVALLVGILVGGITSFFLLVTGRRRPRSKIPYGPFLLLGAAVALLWGQQIIDWYLI